MLKHFEPHRTYRKHTTTELARCVGCFCTTSGWFKHIEPHRTYTLLTRHRASKVCRVLMHSFGVVQAQRTSSNLHEPHHHRASRCVGCLCTRSGWFKHSEPHRTYTNHTITEIARCVGCLGTSSGWFKHSEPHRTLTNHTSLEIARCLGC